MNITRHNYEEYFILYLDNEMCGEDRRKVEAFIDENPDLITELDQLLQSRLVPDTSVVFSNKEQLMKFSGSASINMDNYEEWLLSYTDNELTDEQKIAVENFIAAHPAIKTEFELFQKTKLQPEVIVFPNKESLYRREEKVRIVAISWRRIAVAAALLLAVSTAAFIVFNYEKDNGPVLVENNNKNKNTFQNNQTAEPGTDEQALNNKEVAENTNRNIERNTTESNTSLSPGKERIEPTNKTEQNAGIKQDETQVASIGEEKKRTNDLSKPFDDPNMRASENPIAQIDIPTNHSLTIPKGNEDRPIVTDNTDLTFYTPKPSPETIDPIDVNQSGKKNKLRGFFRKVTRTFEKNTNIKATDDEDRLLLGGLAIKL